MVIAELMQGSVVLWPPCDYYSKGYAESVQEWMRFYEEHDIKPIHKLRSSYHVRNFKSLLIDTGVITKKKNIDCVKKIVDFCHSIGREVASPEPARKILGVPTTGKIISK